MKRGPLIIVSGPSGSGKSTLIHRVLEARRYPLRLAVSATTRPKRPGELDGVAYHFWTPEQFEEQLKLGAFLEHAVVHRQYHYGTPRAEVDGYREKGQGVILDIDVEGAKQVRRIYPEHLSIFIKLSSWEMYEQRLRKRGSETEASIARRLETARQELACQRHYQHVLCNDDLESATQEFLALLSGYFPDSDKG